MNNVIFIASMLTSLSNDVFESGYFCRTDQLIKEHMEHDKESTLKCIAGIYHTHKYDKHLPGLLFCISNISYDSDVQMYLLPVVRDCLEKRLDDYEICDLSIRILEEWRTSECLLLLESLKLGYKDLQNYINILIEEIRNEV